MLADLPEIYRLKLYKGMVRTMNVRFRISDILRRDCAACALKSAIENIGHPKVGRPLTKPGTS
jgi:hypothetical protein